MTRSEPNAAPAAGPPRGVAPLTLVLAVLLAVTTTAAVVLAVAYAAAARRPPAATLSGAATGAAAPAADGPGAAPPGAGPFVQRDAVQPRGETTGVVYFPLPYASIPNLKLTPGDRYLVAAADEFSFTWVDRERASATELWGFFREQADKLVAAKTGSAATIPTAPAPDAPPVPPPPQPELAWEAKGQRGDGRRRRKVEPVEQSGSFATVFGTEGVIYFPQPYASPPHVALSGSATATTVITDCEATHFRWKNGGKNETWGQGSVTWTARGVPADGAPSPK